MVLPSNYGFVLALLYGWFHLRIWQKIGLFSPEAGRVPAASRTLCNLNFSRRAHQADMLDLKQF